MTKSRKQAEIGGNIQRDVLTQPATQILEKEQIIDNQLTKRDVKKALHREKSELCMNKNASLKKNICGSDQLNKTKIVQGVSKQGENDN